MHYVEHPQWVMHYWVSALRISSASPTGITHWVMHQLLDSDAPARASLTGWLCTSEWCTSYWCMHGPCGALPVSGASLGQH